MLNLPLHLLALLPLINVCASVFASDPNSWRGKAGTDARHIEQARSLLHIDAVIAREPTLIFNIPQDVNEEEEDGADITAPHPYTSELDFATVRKRYEESNNAHEGKYMMQEVRSKQANREQVSARLVKQRSTGQKASPSPSPSPRPSPQPSENNASAWSECPAYKHPT